MPESRGAGLYAALSSLGTATVHEVADRVAPLDHNLRPVWRGPSVAGPAYTVKCGTDDNLAVHRAVAVAPAGSILVVAAEGAAGGYWGEVLTVAAQARGLVGLVIDGGVRDTARIAHLAFPVWARHIAIQGVSKVEVGELQVPVSCGGIRVEPGMIVVADDDGVVAISGAIGEEVRALGEARQERELLMLERLREGELTLDLLGLRARLPSH